MHPIGPRYIGLRRALSQPLVSFLTLVGSQLRRAAKTDSTRLCTASALACAGTDQLPLELGKSA